MPAFFRSTVEEFLSTQLETGMFQLTSGQASLGFETKPHQHEAWMQQWTCLTASFKEIVARLPTSAVWSLLLEYEIPGRRKRMDAVILTDCGIIAIEFKVGDGEFRSPDKWQLREYCWNLRDFHRESRGVPIAPILVATAATEFVGNNTQKFSDRQNLILDLFSCGAGSFSNAVLAAHRWLATRGQRFLDATAWDNSPFLPTPSVVEFAQQLFSGHDVREITHSHADNTNIALDSLLAAVQDARENKRRLICFVTGVPGAGKTLVGLDAAYRREMIESTGGAVCFASGNQPLLNVLKEALVMNRIKHSKQRREVAHDISAPVRNVHEFALTTLLAPPSEASPYHVVVFDEAQRVWDARKLKSGLEKQQRRRKLSKEDVDRVLTHGTSEPELLLSVMERCPDWCAIIALVGGGQEIHDGEAGIAEWGAALTGRAQPWTVWVPNEALEGGIAVARQRLFSDTKRGNLTVIPCDTLHLTISKRAFRAEQYSEWVNHVVNGAEDEARQIATELVEYPIWLVRDLNDARRLLREYAGKDRRVGLLASSGAVRLRADGVEVSPEFRGSIKFPDWFLRPTGDIRSSSQLEIAATEFECQGLELDWCGVCWGGDFVRLPTADGWHFRRIRTPAGKTPRWYNEKSDRTREFMRNKYRVLLTRARIGVVVFIPRGDSADDTREPAVFDATAEFLLRCGATPA